MKKFLCLIICLSLLLSFCGCKNENNETENTESNYMSENSNSAVSSSVSDTSSIDEISQSVEMAIPRANPNPEFIYISTKYSKKDIDLKGKKLIAFGIDDGPNDLIDEFTDVFYDNNAHATFFIMAVNALKEYGKYYPSLKEAISAGMELGGHSFAHQNPVQNDYDEFMALDDYKGCFEAIKNATNGYEIAVTRPPYFITNDAVYSVLKDMKQITIGASSGGSTDYDGVISSNTIYDAIMQGVFDGGIVCVHMVPNTLTALKRAIPELQAQNYAVVTVSELLAARGKEYPYNVQINSVDENGKISTRK